MSELAMRCFADEVFDIANRVIHCQLNMMDAQLEKYRTNIKGEVAVLSDLLLGQVFTNGYLKSELKHEKKS